LTPKASSDGKVAAIIAAAGSALILYVIGAVSLVGLWIYGIYDLFLQHKVLEAAIAFFAFPFGVIYGLGRFFGWW
jgi:hypothetical protein